MTASDQSARLPESFLYDHSDCAVIRKDRNKILLRHTFPSDEGNGLFIKVYLHPSLSFRVRARLRVAGGRREWKMSQRLQSMGVPMPTPVGTAEDCPALGFPRRSLYACRWIAGGETLVDFVQSRREQAGITHSWARELNAAIGRFLAMLHRKGVAQGDFNAGNILVQKALGSDFSLLLIDYEYLRLTKTVSRKVRVRNLSQVGAFLLTMEKDAARQLVEGYIPAYPDVDTDAFVGEVHRECLRRREMLRKGRDRHFNRIGEFRKKKRA